MEIWKYQLSSGIRTVDDVKCPNSAVLKILMFWSRVIRKSSILTFHPEGNSSKEQTGAPGCWLPRALVLENTQGLVFFRVVSVIPW